MRNVGPQSLTPGLATVIPDPAQAGGNPSVACQIQNSSSCQLNVLAAGDVLSIQPFTAQTIEISGQPITVTLIAPGSGSPTSTVVTFVFLLGVAPNTGVQLTDGTWVETPPQQDGPLTAAAIAAAISGTTAPPVVAIYNKTITASPNTTDWTATNNVLGFRLYVEVTSGGQVGMTVENVTSGQFASTSADMPQPLGVGVLNVPISADQGDTLIITVTTVGTGNVSAALVGIGAPVATVLLRADGRPYPIGTRGASVSVGTGSGTVIAAPGGGARILLKTLNHSANGVNSSVVGTVNGVAINISNLFGGGNVQVPIPDTGLLLDAGTALTIGAGVSIQTASATYDLVF